MNFARLQSNFRTASCYCAMAVVVALAAVTAEAQVRISQVYTQGGLSSDTSPYEFNASPYGADFVELYNAGVEPVDISGWSIQFQGATATTAWTKFDLTGAAPIQPNSYFLIRMTDLLSGGGSDYPFDLARGGTSSPLLSSGGKVALVSDQLQMANGACPSGGSVVDFVGISGTSTANCSETTPVGLANDPRLSVFRECGGLTESDDNSADFEARSVFPHYSGSSPFPGIEVFVNLTTDNIEPCFPTTAGFQSVVRGVSTLLITASRTTCIGDPSTGGTVTADLTALGGPAAQPLFDDETNGDVTAGDNIYSFEFEVPANASIGPNREILVTITDAQARTQTGIARILVENSAPPNDLCVDAIAITSVPFVDANVNHRFATDDGQPSCISGSNQVRKGVWYTYTPTENGAAIVSETGSQVVAIAAFTGPDCSNLVSMTAAEGGCYSASNTNNRPIPMLAGTTYWILIGPVSTSATFCPSTLDLDALTFEFDFITAPPNDECTDAVDLNAETLPFNTVVQNIGASDDFGVSCAPAANNGFGRRGVWYKYMPASTGVLTLTETVGQNAMHAVFSGSCGSLVEEFCSTTDANQGTGLSAGTQYWILLASDATGAATSATPFNYTVDFTPLSPPPNDAICDAIDIGAGGNFVVDNRAAAMDTEFTQCLFSGAPGTRFGVWYKYTATGDGVLAISEAASQQNIAISVYTGANCGGVNYLTCTQNESMLLQVQDGVTYWFLIGHPSATVTFPTQDLDITFTFGTPPANDEACNATSLTPGMPESSNNLFALPDPDVSCNSSSATNVWHGVWYTYTPGANCTATVTENSNQNVTITYFTGNNCLSLTEYFCTDSENNEFVDLEAGQTYWILIGINSASAASLPTQDLNFTLLCDTPGEGDACSTANVIPALPYAINYDSSILTANAPGGACDPSFTPPTAMRNDAWFEHVATQNCTAVVFVDPPSNSNAIIQAWQGTDCFDLELLGCSNGNDSTNTPDYLSVPMLAGNKYWIQTGRTGTASGGGSTDVSIDCGPPPANDFPCSATVLNSLPANDVVDVYYATHDVWMSDNDPNTSVNFCGTIDPSSTFYGVWYTYTPASDCTIIIEETGAQDVNFGVFSGTCNGLTQLACTGGSSYEVISYPLEANTQYWFLVGTYHILRQPDPSFTPISLTFDCRPAPVNDLPCGALDLDVLGVPFADGPDVAAATSDPRMNGNCVAPAALVSQNGVWYKYTPTQNCTLVVNQAASQDTSIGVYTGSCDFLFEEICTNSNLLSYGLTADIEYHILVSISGISPGLPSQVPFNIVVDCANPPANDTPCGATVISSTPFSDSQSNSLATDDIDILCNDEGGNFMTQKGVWWTYTPATDCLAQITETSSLNVAIAVFVGAQCEFVGEVGCTDAEHFGFAMSAGQQYWILIGLEATTQTVPSATLSMTFDCVPLTPPANDEPCGATTIASLPFFDTPNVGTAFDDTDVACNDEVVTGVSYGVWYQHTPASACTLILGEASANNAIWGIFTGENCGALIEVGCSVTDSGSSITLNAGTNYWILAGIDWSFNNLPPTTPGVPLDITIDCANVPANDMCAGAQNIASLPFTTTYDPFFATDGQPVGSCNSASTSSFDNDVWFSWTAPANCAVTFDLQDISSAFQYGQMSVVHAGPDCNNLVEVACGFSSGATNNFPMFFIAEAGQTYWFQNGRRSFSTGSNLGPTEFSVDAVCDAVCATCGGDMNADVTLDGKDVQNFTNCALLDFGGPPSAGCECANVVLDGVIDSQDVDAFVVRLLDPPPCE